MYVLKSIVSIQTIMYIRLFCGFYYKPSSNILVDVLVKAYCVFLVTVLNLENYLVTTYFPLPVKIHYGLLGMIYSTNVLTTLLFRGENLFEFLKKIEKIPLGPKPNDEIPFSRIWFIFLLLGQTAVHFIYCYCASDDILTLFSPATISLIFELAQRTNNFTRTIMFEIFWRRMAMLRKQLERTLSTARRFDESEHIMRRKLRSCLDTYKNILNSTHETDAPMKFMIFSSIVMLIPKILISIYLLLAYESDLYGNFVTYVLLYQASVDFAVTVTPAVLAEMVNSEIDKMKLCIIKQLLVCRGEPARDAINDAILFLRHHPFKYTILRLLSVDMSFILSLVTLLTTYTIAMVQFAHFNN